VLIQERLGALLAVALASALTSDAAFAVDPFEIQVYDGTANAPGVPGLELHANCVASGRTTADPPELPQDRQTHLTLEPSLGVLPWWEIGGYFQTALRKDGVFEYAGVKLRSKFVTPPNPASHVRLGVNLEASLLPARYDHDRWSAEVRPIAAWEDSFWLLAVNPIIDTPLTSDGGWAGPSLEPAGTVLRKVDDTLSFGLEYYGNLGPLAGLLPWREEEHYLYEVVNLLSVPGLELNAGVGEGLTAASNAFVVKAIVGYTWDRSEGRPSPGASHKSPNALSRR
jgi:hypothetical protein